MDKDKSEISETELLAGVAQAFEGLSEKKGKLLSLIACGMSNEEISVALGVSGSGMTNSVLRLKSALGGRRRIDAAVAYVVVALDEIEGVRVPEDRANAVLHLLRSKVKKGSFKTLSPRERECVALLAERSDAREISEILGVSNRTVTKYISTAAQKLGVQSSLEVAVLYVIFVCRGRNAVDLFPLGRERLLKSVIAGLGNAAIKEEADPDVLANESYEECLRLASEEFGWNDYGRSVNNYAHGGNSEQTERQREVLTLSKGGMSNEDVANALDVSVGAVATHMDRVAFKGPELSNELAKTEAQKEEIPLESHFPLEKLTKREWEIIALLATGLTNAEIAEKLGLAVPTVVSHIQRMGWRVGTTKRVKLAVMYVRAEVFGLIKRNE